MFFLSYLVLGIKITSGGVDVDEDETVSIGLVVDDSATKGSLTGRKITGSPSNETSGSIIWGSGGSNSSEKFLVLIVFFKTSIKLRSSDFISELKIKSVKVIGSISSILISSSFSSNCTKEAL
jgi:hypothetical protein